VTVNCSRSGAGLFLAVVVLVLINAFAPFGVHTAESTAYVLQAVIGLSALLCAAVIARRVTGPARWWRLLVVGAMSSWLVGEVLWWTAGRGAGAAPPLAVAAYFLPPVLSLIAMVILARSGGVNARSASQLPYVRFVAGLDGTVAAVAFSILVLIAGLGATTGAALPRSENTTVVIAYSALELVVVVLAVLIAVAYRRGRPYRTNYLLLSGGVVLIAGSDRLMAYLRTAGVEGADLWGGIGLLVGPLMILFALFERRSKPAVDGASDPLDWVQSLVPYLGFLAIIGLLAFHLLSGLRLTPTVIYMAVALIVLVTTRHVVAMRAQNVLTRRLYDAQRSLAHQVHHDPLTGLPNRLLFARRLDEALGRREFVLIFVDIDDFKEVNDQFGHAAGDDLLCAVGARLQSCVGASDTLARIGGDEFAVLIMGEYDVPEIVADRLRVALRDPFAIHGSSVRVRASMGLVRPSGGEPAPTSDDLLRQADSSMYAGKRLGKDTAVVYRPSSGVSVDFPSALRHANGGVPHGFRLAYQPVVSLPDGVPVAVEALARWTAPNGMQIPPETFVAVAEGAGHGAALDLVVLDLACREIKASGLDVDLHVNIGAARLGNEPFEQQVERTLARHDIDPGRVVLEVTETVPIVDLPAGAAAVRRLSAMGVKVALDDFGAGFNSLTYLHTLPVQIVKLDRSLAVGADPERDLALYRSVIGLCGTLGFDVIAEGIEHRGQADTVFAAGCRYAQGYLFGRATSLEEVARSLPPRPVEPAVVSSWRSRP
jgi:diguanylate cyclase (GGDEF)-like protein